MQRTKSGIGQGVRKFILSLPSLFLLIVNKNNVLFLLLSIGSFIILMVFFVVENANDGLILLPFTKCISKINWFTALDGFV